MPPGRDLIIRLYGLALQIMVVGLYWLALGRDSVVRTEMGQVEAGTGEQKCMNLLCKIHYKMYNMPSVKS